jgi:hypothetical protein
MDERMVPHLQTVGQVEGHVAMVRIVPDAEPRCACCLLGYAVLHLGQAQVR